MGLAPLLAVLLMAISPGGGNAPAVPLATEADALVDPTGAFTLDDVVARNAAFRAASALNLDGTILKPRIVWLRFRPSRGGAQEPWALVVRGDFGRVDLYVPAHAGTGPLHLRAGLDDARKDAALAHRALVVPSAAYGATTYVRVENGGAIDDLVLEPISLAAMTILQRTTLYSFFMGYFVAIAGLYLLLFVILRERPLLQYAAIMAALTLLLFVDSGSIYTLLPPTTLDQRTILHDVCLYVYFILLAGFTTTFLRLLQRDRFAFALIVAAAVLNLTGLFTDFYDAGPALDAIVDPATYAFFGSLFIAGVRAWRSGMAPARFYTFAIGMVLCGYLLNSASGSPLFAPYYVWAFETAIAIEALLLAIAVAERIRETAREYERLLVTSKELENAALRDSLTGVLNRRAFDRGLADAWHAAAARRQKLGLLMIDIDHFKQYNDTYGHPGGDAALARVAQACAGCVRGGDLFARYGGEEFAAIVPNASVEELDAIARRMREAVLALAIEHTVASRVVTVSIGGAVKAASDVQPEQALIALADAALYRAKREGRNRAVLGETLLSVS